MAKSVKQPQIAGIFGVSQAKDLGVSKSTLSRLAAKNKILRLGHGMYLHPNSEISQVSPEEQDYAEACAKFGHNSFIGGLTALFYFGLIEQVPERIWVIVPQTKQTSDTRYRLLRVKKISSIGIEEHNFFRISNIERTLVESLAYSSKMGIRTVIFAIRRAIIGEKTTLEKLMDMAKKLGLENILKKYWETLIASLETL
ncbi:MAG: type IV toxin-antitoxin system AbiEi family antitoxin domain-containing protein [Candidatus Brocadiae bacterium]|nr:type IV toxin-antitoxin system AbiEi family antitoxin domain-containing protein [Candidatus Brocadiia bacterium]